jgi:hypothetical protein
VGVHSSQFAQQHAKASATAQSKEAKQVAEHIRRVHARSFACVADAAAAIVQEVGGGPGRRGRRPQRWHYHTVQYHVESCSQRQKRTRRGRPAQTDLLQAETRYRLVGEAHAVEQPAEEQGWTG